MSDDEPAYARKHRSQVRTDRAFDGGAVAAGLCFGVFAIFVSIAGPLSGAVRLTVTTLGLFCGGLTAGYLARPTASGAFQGAAVAIATAGLMVAVSISMAYGTGSVLRVPLVLAYESLSSPSFAAIGTLAVCLGALSGALGTRLRH